MKNKFIIISVLLSTLLGCSSPDFEVDPILRNDPEELAIAHHTNQSNIEWIGCYGYAAFLPGVPDDIKREYGQDNNIHWITGTGDDLLGNDHEAYNDRAITFAETYNKKRMELKVEN